MARIIMERVYDRPYNRASFFEQDLMLLSCLKPRDAKWVRSLVSSDGLCWLCEFEAPDAEVIRTACRMSGIAFKRVWAAEVVQSQADIEEWTKQQNTTASTLF